MSLETAALIGGPVISAFSQPDPPEQLPSNLVVTSPTQFQLYDQMVNAFQSGAGDFGFGQALRPGMSQLQQAMADRGISSDSGVYTSAMAGLIQNAMAQDAANRYSYGMDLLSRPPQTAAITGQSFVPGANDLMHGGMDSQTLEQLRRLNQVNSAIFDGGAQIPVPTA